MNILVTGATGFVGSALVDYLALNSSHKVVVTTRRTDIVFPADVDHIYVSDITENTDWGEALNNIDCVVHIAARVHVMNDCSADPLSEFRVVNVDGTINLARQAADASVKRFIFLSSIGVNGSMTLVEPFWEGLPPKPHSAYAISKLEAEHELWTLSKEVSMEMVVIRPPLVYGLRAPGNFGTLVKLVSSVPFLPFGLSKNLRSFISIDNLTDFIYSCITHRKAAGEMFLVSDGEDVSTKEFTNAIARGLDKKLYQFPMPIIVMNVITKFLGRNKQAEQIFSNLQVDSSKARAVLDWKPSESMSQAMAKLKR